MGKAQLKILALVVYYTFTGVVGLATYTYFFTGTTYLELIAEYVLCESGGSADCMFDETSRVVSFLTSAVIITIALIPLTTILFSCDPKAFKKKKGQHGRPRALTRSATATSQI